MAPLIDQETARQYVKTHVRVPSLDDGCWTPINKPKKNGYVRVTIKRKSMYLHRLSYYAFFGEMPDGKDVCHSCDVRHCCNPQHLFAGTRLQNMRDAKRKGRLSSGFRHSLRIKRRAKKLSIEKAREIRLLRGAGLPPKLIAKQFGVDVSMVRLIVRGKAWRDHSSIFAALTDNHLTPATDQ